MELKAPMIKSPPLKKSNLFVSIFLVWVLLDVWFFPRLIGMLGAAKGPFSWFALVYFIVFVQLAWLYGIYNIGVVVFAAIYRRKHSVPLVAASSSEEAKTPVAILYLACNDFLETSALSCVEVRYPNYKVYILDDSSDANCIERIDKFAANFRKKVQVIRRGQRSGFKAGNLNHALGKVVCEPLFAVVDADEILPYDFLSKLVPRLEADPNCGFIQAHHQCEPNANVKLKRDMRIGVDAHWKWYQPLRNKYGFVMFLGHGALLRRSCWERVGGFPEIVSEDLAYALTIRENGYYGVFAEDVVCLERFPETVRAFRIRHVKWTRGTCEFLAKYLRQIIVSKRVSLVEKLDILFPTLNLPLTFFFFLFMVNAAIFLPLTIGESQALTLEIGAYSITIPVISMPPEILKLFTIDFYAITVLTIFAPVLCFIIELRTQPRRLFRFLYHSTALYAALSPLSSICVFGYVLTGKAKFLVTGDKNQSITYSFKKRIGTKAQKVYAFFSDTHPDALGVRLFELTTALIFLFAAVASFQIGFIGLAFGFMLLPIMHTLDWNDSIVRHVVWVPFSFILFGVLLGGIGILSLHPVLFGYGFHF